jgi:TM2 domain-containing membrane protein YozV/DNA-directed RNA polymerase subunit RPC12/RpoP
MTFECRCGQPLEADEDMAGMVVECPACNGHVRIPGDPPTGKLIGHAPAAQQQGRQRKIIIHRGGAQPRHAPQPTMPAPPVVMRVAKNRGIYIILGIFFGGLLGIHNFYAGRFGPAVVQLLIMLLLGWIGIGIIINCIWVLIEVCVVAHDGSGALMA